MKNLMPPDARVLVGVLKRKQDLDILRAERWYRMPLVKAPKQKFSILAFYEPARFGLNGKRIRYYARVLARTVRTRRRLLPDEPDHPNADASYAQFRVGQLERLPRPILNAPPRRVSFGFAEFRNLLTARNILELYGVPPTEQIVERGLRRMGIRPLPQYWVTDCGRRYCLDFAILCRKGRIAIECDNRRAHASRRQQARDAAKNEFLRERGWRVIRLREHSIISDAAGCIARVRRAVRNLGGVTK